MRSFLPCWTVTVLATSLVIGCTSAAPSAPSTAAPSSCVDQAVASPTSPFYWNATPAPPLAGSLHAVFDTGGEVWVAADGGVFHVSGDVSSLSLTSTQGYYQGI
jgi:hypothetical protein